MKNIKQKLNCPVRGKLNINKTDSFEEFTEEYRRIECVQFLIDKKYPKENIDFEKEIIKYGHSGRNSLRADLVVRLASKI